MAVEVEYMLSTTALNGFSWVVEWIFHPRMCYRTHIQDFTLKNANGYHTAGKVTFKAEREINIIKQLARDKMKGVFSAAINNLDLNTTSL